MTKIVGERPDFQQYILQKLSSIGYNIRLNKDYNQVFAIDRELLFRFLNSTQSETMAALHKIYKDETEDTIINTINVEETKKGGSRLNILKHGIDISNHHIDLLFNKPATDLNPQLSAQYERNIFSVAEEVWASDKERVDLVIFLNGLAIIAIELKSNTEGQSYQDAIEQYRTERNPSTRLFRFKAGALVCFAIDLEQVYMTTKLENESTYFLPFNQGTGIDVNSGAGNPIYEDKYSVSYMWENILQKDSLIDIITKFIFIETKSTENSSKKTETVVFPRYHQLDVVRKILADVKINKTSQNYLLQHSAGSGKTNEIAWLSHRLASLHDADDKIIFDNIIVCTDKIVVDRQLQQAIMGLEHKAGLIRVMDDKCNSADLAIALKGNTKIIATTIQKFPYILDTIKGLKTKHFAVIIDEAHSGTAGKTMTAVNRTLGSGDQESQDLEDMIANEMLKSRKQENVSMFAFTATPKATTIQLFGRTNKHGNKEAFHIYSMKQAIEEGFILDVLQNYITYKTYYKLNKAIKDDPTIPKSKAKRDIARFVDLHETNIGQRIEVIIEHFRTCVKQELGGQAKAMVITASREAAVKYRQAFDAYVTRKGYDDIHALVAFSGKVVIDDVEYTEPGMNKFSEKKLPSEFDTDSYQVLLVADKYQTGFDQRKLCAMYVLKTLRGVAAVQTLSRLNRICPPYDKKTFVLDFVNDYGDIEKAFSQYYTTTLLSNSVTIKSLYDLDVTIDGYYIIDPIDIEEFNTLIRSEKITDKAKKTLVYLLQKTKQKIEKDFDDEEQSEVISTIRGFIRCYEFMLQASCLDDNELHKKYTFLSYLSSYLKRRNAGSGFNLDGKLVATNFVQKKTGEHKKPRHTSDPFVKLPVADYICMTKAKEERLSEILKELNGRFGKDFDTDAGIKGILQIVDLLKHSDELRTKARNNSLNDFELAFFNNADDALIKGLEQNKDLFTILLKNDDEKHKAFGMFVEEIYKILRSDE